jgi:hypothetical protein
MTTMIETASVAIVCSPSVAQIDALAGERSPLIFDLRRRRDRVLNEIQPAYVWLRPMDDGEPGPSEAMIRFAVRAVGIWDWDGREGGRVVLLADDRAYAGRVVEAMRDAPAMPRQMPRSVTVDRAAYDHRRTR